MANPILIFNRFVAAEGALKDFIRSGPSDGIQGYIRDGYRTNCRRYAKLPVWARALPSSTLGSLGRVCQPYLDDQGITSPVLDPAIPGGQCPGVNYRVFTTTTNGSTGVRNPEVDRGIFRGPFTVTTENPGDQTCPSEGGVQTNWVLRSVGSNAQIARFVSCTRFAINPVARFVRLDGLPDNCGDTPLPPRSTDDSPTEPPPPQGFEPTVDPENPTGPPLIPLPPFNDPVGGPTPIVPLPEPTGPGGGGDQQPDPGEPGAPVAPGPGGDAEGEAPPNSVLVGLRIEILEFPAEPKLYADGVYRGVCYVYMGTEGLLDHDPAGAMLRADQFVYAERENLTHWRVSANNGYSLRVTPYYRELELETV